MKTIHLQKARFKRTKDSKLEYGIMINEDQGLIDADGKPVKQLWDYFLIPHAFSVLVNL